MLITLRPSPIDLEVVLLDPAADYPMPFFLRYVDGLEDIAGKAVLEIGGTDLNNMQRFFTSHGAQYHTVRLDDNSVQKPWVTVEDFMVLDHNERYTLVISHGVFEVSGIDKDDVGIFGHNEIIRFASQPEMLQALYRLTKKGGYNIIGTTTESCFFSDANISKAGFALLGERIRGYANVLGMPSMKNGELLVFQKPL